MKFAKIPYSEGSGFKLINLDLIEIVMVNSKSGTGIILMASKERIVFSPIEMKRLLDKISLYNQHIRIQTERATYNENTENEF